MNDFWGFVAGHASHVVLPKVPSVHGAVACVSLPYLCADDGRLDEVGQDAIVQCSVPDLLPLAHPRVPHRLPHIKPVFGICRRQQAQ